MASSSSSTNRTNLEPQRLMMTTPSLQNTIISNATDVIYYEIVTPKWKPTTTRISKMDHKTRELEVVAELENDVDDGTRAALGSGLRKKMRSFASSKGDARHRTVRLRGQQFRPTGEFWTNDGVARSDARFRGKDGKFYQWRIRKGKPELIREQDPDAPPVAVFYRRKRVLFFGSSQSYLIVQPSVMETLDSLIVSFLLMEQKRRGKVSA